MSTLYTSFASAPKGLEPLLADELRELGAEGVSETRAGASFGANLEMLYRICMWSRIANRILLQLGCVTVDDADQLYAAVREIDWDEHMAPDGTLAVDFSGRLPDISHTHFGALRVKDAIVDQMRDQYGVRPSIDVNAPDLKVNVYLFRGKATISIDLSGDSLHRRGYRIRGGSAPLKENLAAAILRRAGWADYCAHGGTFLDPMCGSGTLAIEAAMMADDLAPGLRRNYFGFNGWRAHDSHLWFQVRAEAEERSLAASPRRVEIHGFDADKRIIRIARENAARIGLSDRINFESCQLAHLKAPAALDGRGGMIAVNPPYGERLGDRESLMHLYNHLGETLVQEFTGWKAAVLTSDAELGKSIGLRARRKNKMYNGAMECLLLQFDVDPSQVFKRREGGSGLRPLAQSELADSDGAQMFANRLKKNMRTIGRWAQSESIGSYRLYDADIPEYAVAVDRYQDWIHLQEYAPPRTVDAEKAQKRLQEVLAVIPRVLDIPADRIVLKRRERQKGSSQYHQMASERRYFDVVEQGVRLLVNLHDYLDTGLFLDHRITRGMVRDLAKGRRFLNLFAYTGTATVYAALGGAKSCTTVDMSRKYLDWAKRNIALNGLSEDTHQFIQADCIDWLSAEKSAYDLIFLDPPTFSNSKRMNRSFDVQRDQIELISSALDRLAPKGILLFSCNRRHFKLDTAGLKVISEKLEIEDITQATLPRDFNKKPVAHYCWKITKT